MKSSLGGTAHVYGLNGSQIQTETIGNKLLVYLYDESGSPIGLQYRTTSYAANRFDTYYFEKNLQGDIIAVYTENGTKVGSYVYDAWGNCSYTYATGASPIQKQIVSTYNPFRYRGYYLDVETGLYYLQTRYYDPAVGRFLSADCYVNANGDLIGFNMYAYCSNNPIKYKDSIGYAIEVCFGLDDRIPGTVGISIGGIAIASTNEKANKLIGKYCSADSLEETIDNGIDFVTGMNPGLYLLRVLHYRRNKFNKVVPPIPDYLLDESESKLHQNNLINGNPNLKYVDDGFGGFFASETVYYSNGKINMTPEDQGTFNVYYGDCWMGKIFIHGTFDVIPYILWGNSPDDSTEIWDRFG